MDDPKKDVVKGPSQKGGLRYCGYLPPPSWSLPLPPAPNRGVLRIFTPFFDPLPDPQIQPRGGPKSSPEGAEILKKTLLKTPLFLEALF